MQWLGLGTNPSTVPAGLQPSVRNYAAYEAYQKLALKFAERLSETYLLNDQPDPDRMNAPNVYAGLAKSFLKNAETLRDHYYTRQGQSLQPLYGFVTGSVREVTPKR